MPTPGSTCVALPLVGWMDTRRLVDSASETIPPCGARRLQMEKIDSLFWALNLTEFS